MAVLPTNAGDIADKLANERALSRMQKSKPPSGRSKFAPSLPISSKAPTRGADYEGVSKRISQGSPLSFLRPYERDHREDYARRLGDSQTGGAPLSGLEQQAVAGRLQAERIREQRRRQMAGDDKKNRAQKQKTGKSNSDYPYPISFRKFVGFGFVALGQDLLPLIFDLLGIGWIIEYCLLPLTWGAYWYLIVRWTPRSLRKKFWQRTILITAVGWIPVVGQFIPEWTATAIGAYMVISMYERRHANLAAGKKRNGSPEKTALAGKASAAPVPAAAGSAAGGAAGALASKV